MRMMLSEIRAALGLSPQDVAASGGDVLVTKVCSDSRQVQPGSLFVCIAGEQVDGHDFVAAAAASGAVAVLVSRPVDCAIPQLLVPDTVQTLGALAHAWRCRFGGKVVGITGTAGKTTVKEVLAQVLSVRGLTARNALNLNNQIGMPLSLLAASGEEEFWVMEAGISQPHDMQELAPVLQPDVALVLNAGAGHTEGLGERGVAWHKAQLLAHVAAHGIALVSSDYPELVREARVTCPQARFFTITGRPVPYRASYGGASADGERGVYRLWLDGTALDVTAPFRGEYGAENAIAVASVAHILGLSAAEIAEGFDRAVLPQQRFQARTLGSWRLIDDSYNANPLSMRRMVEAAADMAGAAPLYAVLGEMGELGDVAAQEHEKLGRLLARSGVQAIFWKGAHFEHVCDGLEAEKYALPLFAVRDAHDFMAQWQKAALKPGVVLCKGSRSNRLEVLVEELAQAVGGREEEKNV